MNFFFLFVLLGSKVRSSLEALCSNLKSTTAHLEEKLGVRLKIFCHGEKNGIFCSRGGGDGFDCDDRSGTSK